MSETELQHLYVTLGTLKIIMEIAKLVSVLEARIEKLEAKADGTK